MAGVFALIVTLSFGYTLYLQIFSMDSKRVSVFAKSLLITSIAGAACLVVSSIIFYVRLTSIDNAELYGNLRDVFNLFAIPACFWTAVVLVITISSHFIGKKMAAIVPTVCHLAALSVLLFTVIFASLGKNFEEGLAINVYMNLFGTFLSLISLFPASLGMKKLSKMLLDKDYVYSRLHRSDKKVKKAEERKRIKETKNRILNNTKK